MLRNVLILAGMAVAAAMFAPDFLARHLDNKPQTPVTMNLSAPSPAGVGGNVHIAADRSGHYRSEIRVNGRSVNALIDTGASFVVLRYEDARSLGLVYGSDRFDVPVQTANGTAHVRRIRLSSVRLGSIELDDIEALVAEEGMLATNLLGMSFLKRLSRYEVRNGTLVLDR